MPPVTTSLPPALAGSSLLTIASLVLLGGLILVGLLAWGQLGSARKIQRAYAETLGSEPVLCEPAARFLGLSRAGAEPSGDGVLLLSETELYFERFHPAAAWRLALDRILKLELVDEFLGVHRKHGLFVLVYHDDSGKTERAGFRVVNADAWIRETGRYARVCKGIPAGCAV